MTLSVLVSLLGLGATLVVLLLTVGIAWGALRSTLASEKERRKEKEIEFADALDKLRVHADAEIAKCRGDWRHDHASSSSNLDSLTDKIEAGFDRLQSIMSAFTERVTRNEAHVDELRSTVGALVIEAKRANGSSPGRK